MLNWSKQEPKIREESCSIDTCDALNRYHYDGTDLGADLRQYVPSGFPTFSTIFKLIIIYEKIFL